MNENVVLYKYRLSGVYQEGKKEKKEEGTRMRMKQQRKKKRVSKCGI